MNKPVARAEIFSVASYVGGESKLAGFETPIKLSSNEGAFGPPPGAVKAIAQAASCMHRYPDGGSAKLREAIGAKFGLDPARIVCTNGSDEVIALLIQSYGGPGTELIMSAHGFAIYEIAGKLAGCKILKAAERDLTTDVDAILALVSPATRMVFIANPNNPTGTALAQGEVERLRANLPEDVLLVLDAAYAEYVERPDYDAGVKLVNAGENAVMTRTFSKIFGMGGARLGWCYAPASVVDVLNRARPPFNVNGFAAAAGIAALAEPGWIESSRAHNSAERRRLSERLAQNGLKVVPSEANFILVDFTTAERAGAADAHLRRHGIIARQVKSYGLPQCLRITIGTAAECNRVAEALAEFCHG
ncbi:histidinol-phosphate transaminase [Acidocella sp.]|uniref:histidinol-phosphate transaminase n=1 Tax=Acidocella sp. TaxID=50710 RepID=UPI003CFC9CE6